jgi:hypothetical protein
MYLILRSNLLTKSLGTKYLVKCPNTQYWLEHPIPLGVQ